MAESYDLAVIGAGPAGASAAEVAAAFGRRAVVIERDGPGGVVTTTGGASTKTLREAALYLTGFGLEEVYGVRQALPLAETMAIIEKRVLQVRDRLQRIEAERLAALGVNYVRGSAMLRPGGGIVVTPAGGSPRLVTATAVVVATGSRPARPAGLPFDDPDVYDSDEVYAMPAPCSSPPVGPRTSTVSASPMSGSRSTGAAGSSSTATTAPPHRASKPPAT